MNEADRIRTEVSESYARLVTLAPEPAPSFGCGDPLAFAEVAEGEVVLDLGAGAGLDLLAAARRVGPAGRVIGVDMTDAMIERARATAAAAGLPNVEVRKGLIEALPVEDASVDWVISNCVINLSPEKPRVFAEIVRVLRPGGRVRISDVVARDLPEWVRASAAAYSACVGGAISEEEYVAGLRDAGLADVEVRGRRVYDAAELAGLADGDLLGCCGARPPRQVIEAAAGAVAGKVWSAIFSGRKPV